jgi:hypothetical protein
MGYEVKIEEWKNKLFVGMVEEYGRVYERRRW